MVTIFVIVIALIGYGAYYLPVYSPFLLSFLFRAPDQQALRIALRVAPLFAVLILAARPPAARPDFGDDVAGNIRGSEYYFAHEFWPEIAWTWGAGLSCLLLAYVVGSILSRQQRRHESAI